MTLTDPESGVREEVAGPVSRWLWDSIPRSIVEIEFCLGQGSLTASFLEQGWQALLFESNSALLADLKERWKSRPEICCLDTGSSLDAIPLTVLLAQHQMPPEPGILVLNDPKDQTEVVSKMAASGCAPWLVALKDEAEKSELRSAKYSQLSNLGYRFAGVKLDFSLWTRLQSASYEERDPHSMLPFSIAEVPTQTCFDVPTTADRFGAAGQLSLDVAGWAFVDAAQPLPLLVYIEVVNIRSGLTTYVQGWRSPRLDVSRHFASSNLFLSGFQATIPMHVPAPEGLRLRVIQCDKDVCYGSSNFLTIDRGSEPFEIASRRGLARKFLRGSGIEIGALQRKLDLPAYCKVRYVDRMALSDLLDHYPELTAGPLQPPDLIADGERLDIVMDGSLDFVVANHFFEHSENPIRTLSNLLRILKPYGIIFMAVPDKRYTFDSKRPSTSFETLRTTFHSGFRTNRQLLYQEWAESVELQSGSELDERMNYLIETNYSIHYNVWSADELLVFLVRVRQEFGLPFAISSVVCSDNETIVLLERIQ